VSWQEIPGVSSYGAFIQRWRGLGLDAVVHAQGRTSNIDYKTNSILLSSFYIEAVPIVGDEAAFRGVGLEEGVIKVTGGAEDWARAMISVADPAFKAEMIARLEKFCRRRFDPRPNAEALSTILDAADPLDIVGYHARLVNEFGRMSSQCEAARLEFTSRTYRIALILRDLANVARNVKKRVIRRSP
jgi:hypothetical protein